MIIKRRLSHITLRYIFNRISVFIYEKRSPHNPWLTADAVDILSTLLKSTDIGVEFGSGRSTKWFAKKLKFLTSIENDELWFNKVKSELTDSGLMSKVDYRLCKTDESYTNQACSFFDDSIDFCLIDGAVRDQCAFLMLPKIKPGGVLVIDNINWFLPNDTTHSPDSQRTKEGCATKTWGDVSLELKKWRLIWTTNGVSDTAIWFKT